MGHGVRDNLRGYWSTVDQLYTNFHCTMMKQDQYLHILSYLHFTDNMNEPDMADENFERPWKIRDLYNPSKNLAVDKLLFPSKGG